MFTVEYVRQDEPFKPTYTENEGGSWLIFVSDVPSWALATRIKDNLQDDFGVMARVTKS